MGRYSREFNALTEDERRDLALRNPVAYRKLAHKAHAEQGVEDLWYFDKYIAKNPVTYDGLHKAVCKRWQSSKKRKRLILMPRGHIKSNLFTAEDIAREIAKNPNVRILIASHKMPDAWKFCGLVKQILESRSYREAYPDIIPEPLTSGRPMRWAKDALLVKRSVRLAEATVETTSADAPVVGRHYDIIKFDDVVTQQSVATPELIRKTTEFVEHCEALLEPGGREDFIGTRYDYADEYGRIIDTPGLAAEFDLILDWKAVEVGGVPIFPTRFTMDEDDEGDPDTDVCAKISIPRLKRMNSVYFVNSQYYNEPVDPNSAMFKLEMLNVIKQLPQDRHYEYFRVCDLSGEGDTDSYTAIVTGAVDQWANIYITDVFWGQYTQREIVDELVEGQRRGPRETWPQLIGFEPAPFERSLRATLDTVMTQTGVIIPYTFLDSVQAQRAKDDRIKGIHWWFSSGKFHVLEGCRHKEELIEEFVRWPRLQRKDIADATSQIPHIMWPAGQPPEPPTIEDEKERRRKREEQRELQAIYSGVAPSYLGDRNVMKPHIAIFGSTIRR